MDEVPLNSNILVLSTAPYNFAGAGTAHARTLELLSTLGTTVRFFSPSWPFHREDLESTGVQIQICQFYSDAYPISDVIAYARIMEEMIRSANAWLDRCSDNRIILLATYLFPFCAAVEQIAGAFQHFKDRVFCALIPAGSDIWQIGRQIPLVTKHLIDSPFVNAVVTYSTRFASEITDWLETQREIVIIPPAIDVHRFAPLEAWQRDSARSALGISRNDFVLAHCSNHRPIKGLSHVIKISIALAHELSEDLHLLMVGPITDHLRSVLIAEGFSEPGEALPYHDHVEKLRVTCVGLQEDMPRYHNIADLAINTSLHDSFNLSLAEAMACEVPVLTSDVVGIAPLIEEYGCGLVIRFRHNPVYSDQGTQSVGNSELELRDTMDWLVRLRRDDALRRILGRNARQAIIERCADTIVASAWCELLNLDKKSANVRR